MWYGTLAVSYDGTVSWIYYMGKHRMWYGIIGGMVRENTVFGTVCWRYGTMVRSRGYMIGLSLIGGKVNFSM